MAAKFDIRLQIPNEPSEDSEEEANTGVLVKEPKTLLKEPSLYKVIIHNDNFTPMDFVVNILETIFNKANEAAIALMLEVHNKGCAICGTYPHEIAETKVMIVHDWARKKEYPLKCTYEKV